MRLSGSRFMGVLAAALLWLLVATPSTLAQTGPIVIRSEGGNTGFPDADNPERIVLVFFGGVDVAMGDRRMRGDTLVAVLQKGAFQDNDSTIGAGESILPDDRVVELFVDGNA